MHITLCLACIFFLTVEPGVSFLTFCSRNLHRRPQLSARIQLLNRTHTLSLFLTKEDISILFSILAENYLLLDVPGAGTPEMMNCCHSGCDNCEFSRVFDCMTSARPKWIPLYQYRRLMDGRDHKPKWMLIFSGSDKVGIDQFHGILQTLPREVCLGPTGLSSAFLNDYPLSFQAVEAFWIRLIRAAKLDERNPTLTPSQVTL